MKVLIVRNMTPYRLVQIY